MDVIFQTHSDKQNRFTMPVEGYGTLYWKKGAYKTSDKELIRKLLSHPLKKRGEYKLVTNKEIVEKYLEGDQPEELTKEILDNVTLEGLVELGRELKATETRPKLIKIEIVGEPITDRVQDILDMYGKNKTSAQVSEDLEMESEEEVETIREDISTDMTAKEAIEWIEEREKDEVQGFVTGDEDRVTVLRAYTEKLAE